MDWNALKIEYITGTISQRDLAAKHGVSFKSLWHHAKNESWTALRQQHRDKLVAKACSTATDYRTTLYELALKVARQLTEMTDQHSISELAAAGVKPRDITGAIKDLEDILHVKSAADAEEQEARIAKLRREAESNAEDTAVKIVIAGEAEELSE